MSIRVKTVCSGIFFALILAACQALPASPEPVVETLVVTEGVEDTPVDVVQVVTPTPEPSEPRILVICLGSEPEDLHPWTAVTPILEAVLEGGWKPGIDTNSFSYQPIILEKIPSLADGDATLLTATVREGDRVVDANGEVIVLDSTADPQQMLSPAGGGEPVPYQGGDFAMEQLSVTFRMLPDLLWSDGTPMTAADSVYAFERRMESENKVIPVRTASYEAMDEVSIRWVGLPGFRDPVYFLNFFSPVPEHVWSKYSSDELFTSEEISRKPLGWGPYVIDEWVVGESITLHKNSNYFRADEGLPKFETLIFRFVGENSSANIAALLSGECDIVSSSLDDQIELLLDLQAADQINASFTTGTVWEHIDFGIQHLDYDDGYQSEVDRPDIFSDVRTRQAFVMCMDRRRLVDTLLLGQSLVMDTYIPPQHPLFNQDVPRYEFDISAASALLEEVGWVDDDGDPGTPRIAQGVTNVPDGTPLEIDYETTTTPIRQQVTTMIKESLAQCGIKANVQLYSSSELFDKIFGRRFDLGQFAWVTDFLPPCDLFMSNTVPGPDGESWNSIQDGVERAYAIDGWNGANNPGFADEQYDAACNKALGSLVGQPDYGSAHLDAQRIFAEQLPIVPLFLRIKLTASRPDMCGLIMDPTANYDLWNIEGFDYGEGCH